MTPLRESTWERIVRGEAHTAAERAAAAALWAASVGYGAAVKLHLAGYRIGLARRTRLPLPVISIGNLTVGGTGKTTAAISVATCLSERRQRVAVLSRGYGRSGRDKCVVVSQGFGPLVPWQQAGDEPFLLARALPGVFVLAGKDRRLTGRRAIADFRADTIVLDDGFQYQRLHKDIEIVLVDALAPFGYDYLVPRGLLREPARHLARADAIWITHCDLVRDSDVQNLRQHIERLAQTVRVWQSMHAPARLRRLDADEEADPEALQGRRVCALSAVGNPLAFERTLERLGAVLEGRARFPDHHPYQPEDLWQVAREQAASADWIVTTEKDAVRLLATEAAKPTWALQVQLAGWCETRSLPEELDCLLNAKGIRNSAP